MDSIDEQQETDESQEKENNQNEKNDTMNSSANASSVNASGIEVTECFPVPNLDTSDMEMTECVRGINREVIHPPNRNSPCKYTYETNNIFEFLNNFLK